MFKRRLGSTVNGRGFWSQCRDILLMAITYNIMLALGFHSAFYRVVHERISP
jgi:hypothetical protein